jgi:S1-C subfamily serine protease
MKFATILCLASTLATGSAMAADAVPATPETAGFAKQYQTYDEALRQKYLKVVDANKDAVVEVEIVWKMKISVQGQQQEQEQKVRLNATVIGEKGVIAMSISNTDPAQMAQLSGVPANMRGQVKIEADVQEVKIITNDGREIPAKVALKDTDLDIMYIMPKEAGKEKLPFIKLAKDSKIEALKSCFSFTRHNQSVGRAIVYSMGYIASEIKTPRRCFIAQAPAPAMPAFNEDGEGLGLFLKPTGLPSLMLVPAKDILASMAQLEDN